MKKQLLILLAFLSGGVAFSQKPDFQIRIKSFFDNTEFGYSKFQMPQTMAGVHVAPTIGFNFEKEHRIEVGADLLHEFGSDVLVGYSDVVAYYQFTNKPFRFAMGAFPREMAVGKYPRIFFQDSIANYRPTINGLVWSFTKKESYANVWLDWTSRQTETRHEAFFMGWSGRLSRGCLYAQHFGYMFHFAGVKNPVVPEALHDNGLMLTSLGIDLARKTGFEKLELNAGMVNGMERARAETKSWFRQNAFLSELKVEYRGVGLFNTFYNGKGQMHYYNDHRSDLYCGDPIYRSASYDRADIYINFLNSGAVKTRFTYSLHFAEGTMYHEQMLNVSIDLSKNRDRSAPKPRYLWSSLLR